MTNENKKQKHGLPEIAQTIRAKKTKLLAMMGVVLVISGSMFFYSKKEKKIEHTIEETYSITAVPMIEDKKPQIGTNKIETNIAPPISPEIVKEQIALIQEKQKELQQRLSAPLMLVNANQSSSVSAPSQQQVVSRDANTQFLNQLSSRDQENSTATTIGPLNSVIAEGSFIHAILEPATNSDLPGNLRASVSAPVYSEDGSRALIPEGSRLIGQYKSGMLQGQSRIFIVWTRLITPQGLSLQLGSPGVDSLGVAGIGADEINRHFWERFGTASLLSLLGAGAANIGVNGNTQDNSAASYRAAVASSFAQSADQTLQQASMIAPTLKSYQGKSIMVFVARDLHFENALSQANRKINIF